MATDTKWTPGPWHTDRPCVTWQNGFGLWTRPVHTSVAGRGFMVAGRTEAEATANARIVAAAPGMAETIRRVARDLRLLLAVPKGERDAADIDDQTRSELEAMAFSLEAAFAKAEGR